MRTSATPQDKVYALDETTLFLLKARSMEDIPGIQTNRKFESESELRSHVNTIALHHAYFKQLKSAIGTQDDSDCQRRSIKKRNAWKAISYCLSVRFDMFRMKKCKDLKYVAILMGFSDENEMIKAANVNSYEYKHEGILSSEMQDSIAKALGFKDWFDISMKSDSSKYILSESVLKRAFGLAKAPCALKESTLNYLAQYMCNVNWAEYNTPSGRKAAREKIIHKYVRPKMNTVMDINSVQQKPANITIPNLQEGDTINITHADGSIETYKFEGGQLCRTSVNSIMCA